jgi:stage II sporulation protein D
MPLLPAQAASEILRVAIEQGVPQINVGSSVNAKVLNQSNQVLGEIQGMNGFTAQPKGGGIGLDRWTAGAITIKPNDEAGVVWIGDRWYRGTVTLIPNGNGLMAINNVDLDQYLFSVLGKEMGGNWPIEALKAQAVAARSYALAEADASRRKGEMFDVGDDQGWQVYGGVQSETTSTQQAVLLTVGQMLVHKGRPIQAFFHSSAGGCTENSENVWMTALPYIKGVKNQFDEGSPVNTWAVNFTQEQLNSAFPQVGNVKSFKPVQTTPVCGRIRKMQVIGDRGSVTVSGDRIREVLKLRSTFFTIEQPVAQAPQTAQTKQVGQPTTAPTSVAVVVNGRGFGHGLGLSQWGAYNMAKRGMNYEQILATYFPQNVALTKPVVDQAQR